MYNIRQISEVSIAKPSVVLQKLLDSFGSLVAFKFGAPLIAAARHSAMLACTFVFCSMNSASDNGFANDEKNRGVEVEKEVGVSSGEEASDVELGGGAEEGAEGEGEGKGEMQNCRRWQ